MIKTLLEGKTSEEKAYIKAREMAKVNLINFSLDGYDIECSNLHSDNGVLTVTLRAFKNGWELKLNNPFEFHNPPILVRKDDALVENPKQAIQEIIVNTIKAVT